MTYLTHVLAAIGGTSVALLAACWLARSLYLHLLSKDIERFKDRLRADADRQSDALRHELEKLQLEHQVRFSKLHDARFIQLHQLHLSACTLSELLTNAVFEGAHVSREERYHKAHEGIQEVTRELRKAAIFLPEAFVTEWREALDKATEAMIGFDTATSWETSDFEGDRKRRIEAVNRVMSVVKKFHGDLLTEARKILNGG